MDIEKKEEVVVNTMANGLSTVFVDNPWFIDFVNFNFPSKPEKAEFLQVETVAI